MSYVENNLVKGEEILFKTRLHWWVIFGFFLRLLLFFFILGVLLSSQTRGSSTTGILVGAILLSLPGIAIGYLQYVSAEFGLTNRRVIIKTGVLRRKTMELSLRKIEGFQADEPLIGRILGFQNLTVSGSGGTKQKFTAVANQYLRQSG